MVIDTINGPKTITVPIGTKHNDEIEIKGGGLSIKGIKHTKLGHHGYLSGHDSDQDAKDRGNHIVKIKI